MGPSGIGKSTLLHVLAGIDHPSQGSIELGGIKISHQSFQERIALLQHHIGIVFQQPCLIAELTVLQNIMLKAIIEETMSQELYQHAHNLLQEVELANKADCYPHILSGGQQQKIAILRAIFQVPQFLLADEPTGNLDQKSAQQIIELLKYYQQKYAMGLIVSTHDLSIAQQCNSVLTIKDYALVNTFTRES